MCARIANHLSITLTRPDLTAACVTPFTKMLNSHVNFEHVNFHM